MKYGYTWNHILLLAKVCARVDDEDSVTASWVDITEDHNRQTFPFTLWPLTYRTCEITTSPAMSTPVHIPVTDSSCGYEVKMYMCNEVTLICIQKNISDGEKCAESCVANLEVSSDDDDDYTGVDDNASRKDHMNHHSHSSTEPLLPCHVSHCYNQIKDKINDVFVAMQDNVECVVCVGHGDAASVASCLASDMGKRYELEKEFLGLEARRVCVDFVGFSKLIVGSPAYWTECGSCIDEYITVLFEDWKDPVGSRSKMIVNPLSRRVTIPVSSKPARNQSASLTKSALTRTFTRSKFILHKLSSAKDSKTADAGDRSVSEYVGALLEKIVLPLNERR